MAPGSRQQSHPQVIDRMLVEDTGQLLDAHGRSSATTRH
jgi:hypothetical protein